MTLIASSEGFAVAWEEGNTLLRNGDVTLMVVNIKHNTLGVGNTLLRNGDVTLIEGAGPGLAL